MVLPRKTICKWRCPNSHYGFHNSCFHEVAMKQMVSHCQHPSCDHHQLMNLDRAMMLLVYSCYHQLYVIKENCWCYYTTSSSWKSCEEFDLYHLQISQLPKRHETNTPLLLLFVRQHCQKWMLYVGIGVNYNEWRVQTSCLLNRSIKYGKEIRTASKI